MEIVLFSVCYKLKKKKLSKACVPSTLSSPSLPRMEDPCGSPLAELGKWRRRQVLLGSLVEQLRSKACRAILGALVATKSRLLKKWKNIDLQ